MSTELARELDHRYRTRFANDAKRAVVVSHGGEWWYRKDGDTLRYGPFKSATEAAQAARAAGLATDDAAKTLNPPKVAGAGADAAPGRRQEILKEIEELRVTRERSDKQVVRDAAHQKIQTLTNELRSLGKDAEPLAMPPAKDVSPGIFYVSWKNDAGEMKKIRVAAESEEKAIQQSKQQLRGTGWVVVRVDQP